MGKDSELRSAARRMTGVMKSLRVVYWSGPKLEGVQVRISQYEAQPDRAAGETF